MLRGIRMVEYSVEWWVLEYPAIDMAINYIKSWALFSNLTNKLGIFTPRVILMANSSMW